MHIKFLPKDIQIKASTFTKGDELPQKYFTLYVSGFMLIYKLCMFKYNVLIMNIKVSSYKNCFTNLYDF